MKNPKPIVFFMGLIFFMAIGLAATETGEIQGRVADENGEGLPGVEISAKSASMQGIRSVLTSQNGEFLFPLLPIGRYTLTFELDGFTPTVQENVTVRLGKVTTVNMTMPVSEIKEEIVVIAASPLIDKTSIDTSYYLGSEEMEKLPSQNRTVVDVVKFAPGVTGVRVNTRRGVAIEGQPSIRGEGEEGNNWILDGLSISGVRLRSSGMPLNYDSIEEIQVISDPFSPEYGSAQGGVINMVTKSGGNDFSGEFSLVFQNKNLQAGREDQLAVVSEADYFSNANWYLNLGGPIIKDKLWFFISENLFTDTTETREDTVDYLMIPGGALSTQRNNLFAKFSYAFNSHHNLSLTTSYHKSMGQLGGIGIPELFDENRFSDFLFRINYKGILSPTAFVEAGFGRVARNMLTDPVDGDLGPAQFYIEDLGRNINNSYGHVIDDSKRLDFNIKFTKFFDTDNFGQHEFKLGFEYYAFDSQFAVDFTGKDDDIFPGNGFDAGTKYYWQSWREGQKTPSFFYEYGTFDFTNFSHGIGLFFADKVTWGRVTVMLGMRSQTQMVLDNNKEKLWSWSLIDFLSPRLSAALDITGDGANVLKLGWGRFSDSITTMPMGLLNSGAGLTFRTYRWQGAENPSASELKKPANWEFENEQKLQGFEIAERLKPNFLTRYLIEFDRRLGRDWAVAARYVRTSANDLLEILALFDTETLYRYLYDNFEYKRRNYQGFELEVNGRIGRKFYLNASYSHSSAKGTNPGQVEYGSWSQEEGSTNYLGLFGNHLFVPNLPGLEAIKEYVDYSLGGLGGRGFGDEGWYGTLPYSIDHNIKLNLFYLGPYGLSFSTSIEYISGYYWEKLGYVPFFGGYYAFPETRGTRKTPAHTYLDLGVEKFFDLKGIRLLPSMGLTVRLDIFNLLNSQTPISYVKEDIPIFGAVWGRQQPRQARILIKLSW
ncbi:MAG: TonB-dependent receptor [Candidatus Aminicenantes bacterium]|nr:TonB-dependent receptor [Candidatus Aminicenantes bacterium]